MVEHVARADGKRQIITVLRGGAAKRAAAAAAPKTTKAAPSTAAGTAASGTGVRSATGAFVFRRAESPGAAQTQIHTEGGRARAVIAREERLAGLRIRIQVSVRSRHNSITGAAGQGRPRVEDAIVQVVSTRSDVKGQTGAGQDEGRKLNLQWRR